MPRKRIDNNSGIWKANSNRGIPDNGLYSMNNLWTRGYLGATYPAPRMFHKVPKRDNNYKDTMDINSSTRGMFFCNFPGSNEYLFNAVKNQTAASAASSTTKDFTITYAGEGSAENWMTLCLTGTGITTTIDLMDEVVALFTAQYGDIVTVSVINNLTQVPSIAQRIYSGAWIDLNPAIILSIGQMVMIQISNPGRPNFTGTLTLTGDTPDNSEGINIITAGVVASDINYCTVPYNSSITTLQGVGEAVISGAISGGYTAGNGDTVVVKWRNNSTQVTYTTTGTYAAGWAWAGDSATACAAGDAVTVDFNDISLGSGETLTISFPYGEYKGSLWGLNITSNAWQQLKPPLYGGTNSAIPAVVTFTNASAAVLGTGATSFTSLSPGTYIRRGVAPYQWYMIKSITDDTHLTLIEVYNETTGDSGVGTAQQYEHKAYNFSFEQYHDKLYSCGSIGKSTSNGGALRKWDASGSWSNAPYIRDTGSSSTSNITGTLTFTQTSSAVVGSGGSAFTTELEAGDYITVDPTATPPIWYEVLSITDNTHLTLMTNYAEVGAGHATCDFAYRYVLDTAQFIKLFKSSLWVIDTNQYVTLRKAVTGNPEDWTGTGAYQQIFYNESICSGFEVLGDYLLIFFPTKYYVYKFTGDVDAPIEEVNVINYGCSSPNSITNVGDYLIYFTGADIRVTSGGEDVSISNPQIDHEFNNGQYAYDINYYYTLSATDSKMPFGVYNKALNTYTIYFPLADGVNTHGYIYDLNRKTWIGELVNTTEGHGVMVRESSAVSKFVWASSSEDSNQLYYTNRIDSDDSYFSSAMFKDYDFGEPDKKKKIKYVDITFYTEANCNLNLTFSYWADVNDQRANETFNLLESDGDSNYYVKKRFRVNDLLGYTFQFQLAETSNTGGTGWGVDSVVINYEVLEKE